MNTAHNSMRLSSPTELNTLRNIYTICCILRAIILCDLLQFHEAISSLDHAIIIAGAPGKLDLILHLIRGIQAKIGQETAFRASGVSVQKCDYFKTNYKEDTVPSIVPPSFLSFQLVSSKSPFILRDYARDWPAMEERPWRSAAYLRSISGPGRVVPVEIGDDYRSENWKQKIMPWDEFLSTLNLEDQPTSDFSDYPQYRQPVSEDNLLFNTWLGPEGTMSPAHTVRDHKHDLALAQFRGDAI
ncbi:JmjC domain-containing protein D [Psilocybe cubensis]|uniref:JmjC domain-containing protein D n=2 Tax=Psilocybe cubensis TaxID=181762 RepID=A0ACB8H8Z5_PSICU|nr:JmjC domain-containing protein D [Psilocybe cubensis]KAH9484127.1 JmjC domain-containing protein D [Psilocybe cubensis]